MYNFKIKTLELQLQHDSTLLGPCSGNTHQLYMYKTHTTAFQPSNNIKL